MPDLGYRRRYAAADEPQRVPHPDQSGCRPALRIVMSLRAVGEGHISSVAFREGHHHLRLRPFDPGARTALRHSRRAPDADDPQSRRPDHGLPPSGQHAVRHGDLPDHRRQQRNGLEDLRLVRFHP
jgi:hypothetical protein